MDKKEYIYCTYNTHRVCDSIPVFHHFDLETLLWELCRPYSIWILYIIHHTYRYVYIYIYMDMHKKHYTRMHVLFLQLRNLVQF